MAEPSVEKPRPRAVLPRIVVFARSRGAEPDESPGEIVTVRRMCGTTSSRSGNTRMRFRSSRRSVQAEDAGDEHQAARPQLGEPGTSEHQRVEASQTPSARTPAHSACHAIRRDDAAADRDRARPVDGPCRFPHHGSTISVEEQGRRMLRTGAPQRRRPAEVTTRPRNAQDDRREHIRDDRRAVRERVRGGCPCPLSRQRNSCVTAWSGSPVACSRRTRRSSSTGTGPATGTRSALPPAGVLGPLRRCDGAVAGDGGVGVRHHGPVGGRRAEGRRLGGRTRAGAGGASAGSTRTAVRVLS